MAKRSIGWKWSSGPHIGALISSNTLEMIKIENDEEELCLDSEPAVGFFRRGWRDFKNGPGPGTPRPSVAFGAGRRVRRQSATGRGHRRHDGGRAAVRSQSGLAGATRAGPRVLKRNKLRMKSRGTMRHNLSLGALSLLLSWSFILEVLGDTQSGDFTPQRVPCWFEQLSWWEIVVF